MGFIKSGSSGVALASNSGLNFLFSISCVSIPDIVIVPVEGCSSKLLRLPDSQSGNIVLGGGVLPVIRYSSIASRVRLGRVVL
jgi:hypothetical protein